MTRTGRGILVNKVSEKVEEISAQMAATSVKVSSAKVRPELDPDVIVSIQGLQKSFGDNEVLRDVNIDVRRGEVVVVLGPSGSGKSTMLRCINLLEVPTGGHIYFEGKDITDKKTDINKLRTGIGMVTGSRKKERGWTVSVERGPKELRGVSIAVHGPVIVGRSPGADIVIGAGYVSGRHARFQLMGQNLFVEDLGSKNGTAVNGRPVHDPVALRNKDLVTIGDVDIRVRNQ